MANEKLEVEGDAMADTALHDAKSLVSELRKKDPVAARRWLKKLKKKNRKPSKRVVRPKVDRAATTGRVVEIEYTEPDDVLAGADEDILHVFQRFEQIGASEAQEPVEEEAPEIDFDEHNESDTEEYQEISKKRLLRLQRPTLMHLKSVATRPDVVEIWDTTAPDPELLVFLKSMRNTIGMPAHWSAKRRYLSGKKGYEKKPFALPAYVEATKIQEIRRAIMERDANKTLKQRQREKLRPKSSRFNIDYQALHDAFFKHATKPTLTIFGDMYYEGKELEQQYDRFKPGQLSDELKAALGMHDGMAPPWLINMQRYGPPPAYPTLRIPGVNAPIPTGATYGYQSGGWGQPPVDQLGNPLFNNYNMEPRDGNSADEPFWGELPEGVDEEEEEEELDAETEKGDKRDDISTTDNGIDTPLDSGIKSVATSSGICTPVSKTTSGVKPYQILQPSVSKERQAGLMVSTNIYKMPIMQSTGAATPMQPGIVTPNIPGFLTPLGNSTPMSGFSSVRMPTPFGVSSSVENEFSAESIRQQLKSQGEQVEKVKQAAKIVETEAKKKSDKKKKKEFKF